MTRQHNPAALAEEKEETIMKEITLTLTETQLHLLKCAISNMGEITTSPIAEEALDDIYNQIEKAEA